MSAFWRMKTRVPTIVAARSKFARGQQAAKFRAMVRGRSRMNRRRTFVRTMGVRTAGFLGIERKFYDTSLGNTALVAPTDATGGEFDPSATSMISTPAVGDTEQNRDGKKINILSVAVSGTVSISAAELAAGPAPPCRVFIALVLDTQTNAAQMNSEDCFKNIAASALTASVPMRNLLFGPRFRVLKEMETDITPQTLSHFAVDSFSHGGVQKSFKWFLKFPKGLPISFNAGTTASVANVIDNSLHMIAYVTNTTSTPGIAYSARIRFVG